MNQRPIVGAGEQGGRAGDVLADGPSTSHGEISLGKNILVGYMNWEGYNYEDAILLNERLVMEDTFSSIHVEEFECNARDTKLGPEEITRDIPGVGDDALQASSTSGALSAWAPRSGAATSSSARSRPRARPTSRPRRGCCAPSSARRRARCATPR